MEITLGADPEFIIQSGGTLHEASRVFSGGGAVGTDGCSTVAELRPGRETDVWRIGCRVLNCITKAWSMAKESMESEPIFLAGHFKERHPIGGHIHISTDTLVDWPRVVGVLDTYVGAALSDLVDPTEERGQRRGHGYGQLGSWNRKGPLHIEYRTPGSWLLSPKMTIATFTVAKAAIETWTNSVGNPPTLAQVAELDYAGKRKLIMGLFAKSNALTKDVMSCRPVVDEIVHAPRPDWNDNFAALWM